MAGEHKKILHAYGITNLKCKKFFYKVNKPISWLSVTNRQKSLHCDKKKHTSVT